MKIAKIKDLLRNVFNGTTNMLDNVLQALFPRKNIFLNKRSNTILDAFDAQCGKSTNTIAGFQMFFEAKMPVLYKFKYRDPEIKRLMWQFKYYKNAAAISALGNHIYDELISLSADRVSAIPFHGPVILIHCPSSTYFKGEKNFDHMKELFLYIDQLNDEIEVPLINSKTLKLNFFTICTHAILPNLGATKSKAQHFGNRQERFKWSKNRFVLSEAFEKYISEILAGRELSGGLHIYCIDDIVTTGASFEAISSMLKTRLGVKVKCVALCH